MGTTMKNMLGLVGIISILLTVGILNKYVNTYGASIQPASFRSFSATGEGKVIAVPDVAQFNFGVITEGGTKIADLQTNNTKKMNAALDFLKKNGVADKDIKTEQYSLQPRTEYSGCQNGVCPPSKIVGYTINQMVNVKVRDFNKIGDIMSGIATQGVNTVSDLRFAIDDPKKVQNEARAEAFEEAKIKAESIAKAGGFTLGRLLSIDEGSQSPIPRYESFGLMDAKIMAEAAPAPTIEPGSQDVVVNVTLRYEIN